MLLDVLIALVWIAALSAVCRGAITRPKRHQWAEFNSADVAHAARKGKR